jgi:hypothetical protein
VNDIARVISRLEQQRATIDRAISALREVEEIKPAQTGSIDGAGTNKPKKRRMSAAGRRRIAEGIRKHWAEKRAAEAAQAKKASATTKTASPKKSARKLRSA